jgi:dynein heavy chain
LKLFGQDQQKTQRKLLKDFDLTIRVLNQMSAMSIASEHTQITGEALDMEAQPRNNALDKQTLTRVISRFKQVLSLTDYNDKMWTESHEDTVFEFLTSSDMTKLIGYVGNDLLVLQNGIPSNASEIFYFIKQSKDQITEINFEEVIRYGALTGDAMSSLLRLMENVYLPLFATNKNWPESLKKDFNLQLHRFMALLTDTTHQLSGHTVLYVPNEDLTNIEAVAKTKDVVQRLESLLVHWTRQIKEVINSQHNTESIESSGPLEEIEFWRRRCDDLSGISHQINREEVVRIVKVLELAKSSYLDQFNRLSNLINGFVYYF